VGADRAGNEVGIVLERHLFDKALAADAAVDGAQIMLKTHASGLLQSNGTISGIVGKSMGQEMEIRAKIIIGADGFESQVGRWAGIKTGVKTRDVDATIQYRLCNIDCDPRYCDFFVGSCAPGGYIWIFPKSDHVANVGIGVQFSLLKTKAEVRGYLDRWIATQPNLAKGQALEIVGGAVSTNKPIKQTVTDNVMLVGDAARLIDPLTGGGIVNACISGKLAGEIAAEAIRKENYSAKFLNKYEKAWRKRMEKKLTRNWMAKEKVASLDDATFDSIVGTLAEVGSDANTLSLLIAIGKKHPKLVADFAELMFA
jgi:digeranylgeranylglycerophospholipid reductase